MKNKGKWLVALMLVLGIIIGVAVQELRFTKTMSAKNLESILHAYNIAKDRSVNEFTEQQLVDGMISGLAGMLEDDYAHYYTAEELVKHNDDKNGIIRGGIGVVITSTEEGIVITEVYPDSPAQKVGMKAGDVFLAVDDTSVVGLDADALSQLVGGENGTEVKIRVRRGSDEIIFNPVRALVTAPMVKYRQIEDITYIEFLSFNGNAVEKFTEAIKSAEDTNAKGIIIDLRDNLGGSLDILAKTADLILPEGDIIYAMDRHGNRISEKKSDASRIEKPIVILTNAYSASASEAFTGAARDHAVAITVGTRTYGKGIMQTTYNLPNDGAFKLTTAKYYLPKGECIQGVGITPDHVVQLPGGVESRPADMTDAEDTQLQRALELLRAEG